MMKPEFEKLYGSQVTWSIFEELNRQYMADETCTKEQFVARCKRTRLVEKLAMKALTETEERENKLRGYINAIINTPNDPYRDINLSIERKDTAREILEYV